MSMTHMSLVRAASGHHKDHVDVHGLCITGSSPHWMQRALESWSRLSSLANSRTGERRPCALPRQHSGTGSGSSTGVWVSHDGLPVRELTLALICWGWHGCRGDGGPPLPLWQSGKLPTGHELRRAAPGRRGVGESVPLSGVRWYGADTLPFPSSSKVARRADTGIMRTREVAPPPYRLQHSWLHLTWTIQWSWP